RALGSIMATIMIAHIRMTATQLVHDQPASAGIISRNRRPCMSSEDHSSSPQAAAATTRTPSAGGETRGRSTGRKATIGFTVGMAKRERAARRERRPGQRNPEAARNQAGRCLRTQEMEHQVAVEDLERLLLETRLAEAPSPADRARAEHLAARRRH